MELEIGNIKLPMNAATKTFAILAKRGAGKSYTAAVLAEEFSEAGVPFVVLDPIDVWWGLRLSADGKKAGLPVVVFGGEHGDLKLDRDMGKDIARAVVRDNVSCVICTFGMSKNDMRKIVADFAEELLNINNTPRHVFVEEAHEFVPQRVQGAMGRIFAAVEALVVMGRNRGIGVTLINQRAATVNKDVLTQLDTLLAFRNTSPQDRKALKEWVEAHGAEDDFNKFFNSLPSLPTGEGWIWSPEFMGIFKKIKIRKRRTFHPDREKMGARLDMVSIASADINSFVEGFKNQIRVIPDMEVGGTVKRRNKKGEVTEFEMSHVGVQKFPIIQVSEHEAKIREITNTFESQLISKDSEIRRLTSIIKNGIAVLQGGAANVGESTAAMIGGGGGGGVVENKILAKLGGMARNIYQQLLDQPEGLTRRQIGIMCGYSIRSGSFINAVSKLNRMGMIKKEGDLLKALLK